MVIIYFVILQMAGITLPYDNLNEIRFRLEEVAPHLVRYGNVEPANFFTQALEIAKVCILIRCATNFLNIKTILSIYTIYII